MAQIFVSTSKLELDKNFEWRHLVQDDVIFASMNLEK